MQKRCKVLKGFMAAFLVVLLMSVFPVVVSAQGNTSNPQGAFYEFGEKDNYAITENKNGNSASSIGSLGLLSVTGDFEDQGNDVYYVQNGNIDISYNVNFDSLETDTKKWHLTGDKTKTVDGIKLDENIQKGAIIVQSSLDGENWLVDNVYTNVFSRKEKLPTTICTTKDIHQLNGCFYRVIVAYKLERQIESSQVLFWEKNNYEYIKIAEEYTLFVIDQHTVDSGTASPEGKPRKEFGQVINTGKDNGFDATKAKAMDKDDPFFDKSLGYFTVNGYTRETTDKDGGIVFLKTVGDEVTLWFTLTEDINKLFGNENLSISEDKNGYDKALGVSQTNFKHGALIVKYTDEEGHSPETVKYFDFLAANAMNGADTRIKLYEEGEYEITLDFEVCNSKGFDSYSNYKMNFKFAIRNGNTMAFPRDAQTGSELKDGAWTSNGFTIDLAESKYLTIDVVRREVNQNADGTLSSSVRNNTVGKDGSTYTKDGIYEITVKNQYSDSNPTTVTLYVGNNKNIIALANTGMSIEQMNELIKNGTTIDENGSLVEPTQPAESLVEEKTTETQPVTDNPVKESEESEMQTDNTVEDNEVSNLSVESPDGIESSTDDGDGETEILVIPFVVLGVLVASGLFVVLNIKRARKEEH